MATNLPVTGTGSSQAIAVDDAEAAIDAAIAAAFTAANVGPAIHGQTQKETLVNPDTFAIIDSEASNALGKIRWQHVKAAMWSAFGVLIAGGTSKATPVDADELPLADSAALNATKRLTLADLWVYIKAKADTFYASSVAGSIANANLADMAETRIKGRKTGDGTGAPQDLLPADVRTIINVEAGADVTDTANVTAAGALMDSEVTSLAAIKDVVMPTGVTITTFAATVLDDTTASAARTTLGLGTAATTAATAYASAAQGATADTAVQPGADIDDLVETATAKIMTGDERTKLAGIETAADVTDAANVTAAGALMDSELTALTGVKTLTVPDNTTISAFGKTLVDDADAATALTTLGLGTAATTAATAYATAAQGATADTAVQPSDIGTAAAEDVGAFATAAQGALADTAIQSAAMTAAITTETAARDLADVVEEWRPGENRALFSSVLTGAPEGRAVLAIGTAVANVEGLVLRLTGADADVISGYADVAPRVAKAMEIDRVYRVRLAVRRNVDPADPLSDGVELRIRNLNASKSGVSDATLAAAVALTVAMGRVVITVLICRGTPPAGVTVYAPPATARYAVPFVRVYGVAAETDIEVIDWQDVTDGVTAESALDARLDIVEPLAASAVQPGDDVDDLAETATAKIMTGDERTKLTALPDSATLTASLDLKAPLADLTAETLARVATDALNRAHIADSDLDAQVDGWALAVRDAEGETAGIDDTGALVGTKVKTRITTDIDQILAQDILIEDLGGSPLLSADPKTGRVAAPYGWHIDAPSEIDQVLPYVPLVEEDGQALFVLRSDGFDMLPSSQFIARVSYQSPTLFLGGRTNIFGVRSAEGYRYATVQLPDGYVGDIVQIAGRSTAIPVSTAPLELVQGSGQSNMGYDSGPNEPEPITGNVYQDHVLTVDAGGNNSGGTELSPAATDFISRAEPISAGTGASPMAMFGYALGRLLTYFGQRNPGVVVTTTFRGGTALDDFHYATPSIYLAENLVTQAADVATVAADYARDVAHSLLFIQGEAGPDAGWQTMFEGLVTNEFADAATAAGSATQHVFVMQINTSQSANEAGSGWEILAWARANLAVTRVLCGPMYQQPLTDVIHSDNYGRMIGGEVAALAWYWAKIMGEAFHPLWPTSGTASRTGAVITVPLTLPPGCVATDLRIDDDWVEPTADAGFVFTYGGVVKAISSVAISGSSIVITLTADPGASAVEVLTYAGIVTDEVAGWSGCRGQIYADSRIASPFYRAGHPVPPTIRHYMARFQETLA